MPVEFCINCAMLEKDCRCQRGPVLNTSLPRGAVTIPRELFNILRDFVAEPYTHMDVTRAVMIDHLKQLEQGNG